MRSLEDGCLINNGPEDAAVDTAASSGLCPLGEGGKDSKCRNSAILLMK